MEFIIEFADNVKSPVVCGKISPIIEYISNYQSKGLCIEEKVIDLFPLSFNFISDLILGNSILYKWNKYKIIKYFSLTILLLPSWLKFPI